MSTQSTNVGTSFFSLLTILFIGLKLTGYINWSWWLVLAPWLAYTSLILLLVAVLLVFAWLESYKD